MQHSLLSLLNIAQNVRVEFSEGIDCIFQNEIESKFPIQTFAAHGSVELQVWRAIGMTRTKYMVKLTWDDDYKDVNTTVLYPTIQDYGDRPTASF